MTMEIATLRITDTRRKALVRSDEEAPQDSEDAPEGS
jgi:hypothetical protein